MPRFRIFSAWVFRQEEAPRSFYRPAEHRYSRCKAMFPGVSDFMIFAFWYENQRAGNERNSLSIHRSGTVSGYDIQPLIRVVMIIVFAALCFTGLQDHSALCPRLFPIATLNPLPNLNFTRFTNHSTPL